MVGGVTSRDGIGEGKARDTWSRRFRASLWCLDTDPGNVSGIDLVGLAGERKRWSGGGAMMEAGHDRPGMSGVAGMDGSVVRLVRPDERFRESFLDALAEFRGEGRYLDAASDAVGEDFAGYVRQLDDAARGENLAPGLVPYSTFWLVDRDQYIGRLSIRHELNEWLRTIGGHIGYDIRPTRRREGLGMRQLQLGLVEARKLGLERVLLTCDADNTGSRKIIEGNGGVLEDEVLDSATGKMKLRFWIDL